MMKSGTIKLREKCLKHFKSAKLHFDATIYKESTNLAMKLIKVKKKQFYKEKLKEDISKPKRLWKALISLGLLCKKGSISNICLKKDGKTSFDDKMNANNFKEIFSKLPPPSNKLE